MGRAQAGAWALACTIRIGPFVLALPYQAESELYSRGIDLGLACLAMPDRAQVLSFQQDMQALFDADELGEADTAQQCLVTLAYALDTTLPREHTTVSTVSPILRVAGDSERAWETLDYRLRVAEARAQGMSIDSPEVRASHQRDSHELRELRAQADALGSVATHDDSIDDLLAWLGSLRADMDRKTAEMRTLVGKWAGVS